MTKLKKKIVTTQNSNCDKTEKTQIATKLENSNCDKTKKENCDKTQNSNCDKTQKLKWRQNLTTQIVTKQKIRIVKN